MSASINRLWKSLTPEDKKIIKDKLGVDPDAYTTSRDRIAVLAQYYEQIGGCPPPILNTQYPPSPRYLESGSRPRPRMIAPFGESIDDAVDVVNDGDWLVTPSLREIPSHRENSPPRTITLSRGRGYTPDSHSTSYRPVAAAHQFLRKAGEYAAIVVFTIAGAYGGFSAARYTNLADELRRMEKNPIIKT